MYAEKSIERNGFLGRVHVLLEHMGFYSAAVVAREYFERNSRRRSTAVKWRIEADTVLCKVL